MHAHVTGVTSSSWYLFSGSRNLTKGIGVRRHVGKDDQDVLLELVGKVFGRRQGETGCDDTLDSVIREEQGQCQDPSQ